MINYLILLGLINFNQPDCLITIKAENLNVSYQRDSILYLTISVKNLTNRRLYIPNIKNARPGMICSHPNSNFIIQYKHPTENKTILYGSPFAMCHLFKPDIIVKKNRIINIPISIDFKHLSLGDSIFSVGENEAFGEYEIYLILKTVKNKVYLSNKIRVIYQH